MLLVLGAPVTLALRALPAAGRGDPPSLREWILAALHSRVSRFLTNPFVAIVLTPQSVDDGVVPTTEVVQFVAASVQRQPFVQPL